jgi:hypothetical protein
MPLACPTLYSMKIAVAVAILLAAAPLALADPGKNAKSSKAPAKAPAPAARTAPKATAPVVGGPRLRHETIGIMPGYGSLEAGSAALARKDDDTAIDRSLTAAVSGSARASGPFAAVEATVMKKKPRATGRVRVSFDVDRRGRVLRPMALGFDKGLDRAIEAQLKTTVLPAEYAGQHVDTVLAFQKGKLLRR